MMPEGGGRFTNISVNHAFSSFGGRLWDGKYLALGQVEKNDNAILRVAVSGSSGTVVGTVPLDGAKFSGAFWFKGNRAVVPYKKLRQFDEIGFWNYPAGGRPRKTIKTVRTVSLLDELVLARSAFQYSLNYRSVIALGLGEAVTDEIEKLSALEAIVEQVCRGRWNDVRAPRAGELRLTIVLRIPLDCASAKIRTGPPDDFPEDLGKGIWAGCVPLRVSRGMPIPDPTLEQGVRIPPYL